MPNETTVTNHYSHGSLLGAIREGVATLGKRLDDVTLDDLGPVDEFHVGGRVATKSFLDQLSIKTDHHLLDVGCGLGGSSRFAAHTYGCRTTGIDLTQEYIDAGNELCSWVGLADRINLEVANATALPFEDEQFDRAFMLHVGMNIENKNQLAQQLYRVVRPGGKVGIYDIMQINDGDLKFPVPWATDAKGSCVSPVAQYISALEQAGFTITAERNRRDFALEFLTQLQSNIKNSGGPAPLGLHILMGSAAAEKVNNMLENFSNKLIAPIELIAEKPR